MTLGGRETAVMPGRPVAIVSNCSVRISSGAREALIGMIAG